MGNKDFIMYLNSLHNYNAQNHNAYGEKNVENKFFKNVMVRVGLSNYILQSLKNKEPHLIILTGHAGDGKTSIMYQVLSDLNILFEPDKKICDYTLDNGKQCRCIKDFSEIADEEKVNVLKEAVSLPNEDKFVFMVANTGPLINTFGALFPDNEESEKAKIQLIESMDSNSGNITNIKGYKLCVINVATVDNTYFAVEFLDKLTQDELWGKCSNCAKKDYCHILRNRTLIKSNKKQVHEFLNMHYIWLTEHGKRLTIRSMTEQLAYMITGGFECEEVVHSEKYKYLFSNLFFGYVGTLCDTKATNIIAIKEARNCGYDSKRLRSDEVLLVNHGYEKVFGSDMVKIISDAEQKNAYLSGWNEFLRRAYFFMNIVTDEKMADVNYEDIFSKQFKRFLDLRNGKATPSKADANLVCDALSMIYMGAINNDDPMIPLTLSRESGIAQNVQLITGTLMKNSIKIKTKETRDSSFNDNKRRNILLLEVNKTKLENEITLPLLNYFEELKNGIISTNVDPQLSHGIESLKAELTRIVDDDNETFEMIILRNNGAKPVELEIMDKRIKAV
ncbi:MAG: hypothetical protein ACLR9S_00200 [Lachnospiraceae bacterium]